MHTCSSMIVHHPQYDDAWSCDTSNMVEHDGNGRHSFPFLASLVPTKASSCSGVFIACSGMVRGMWLVLASRRKVNSEFNFGGKFGRETLDLVKIRVFKLPRSNFGQFNSKIRVRVRGMNSQLRICEKFSKI
jgi:hypothetical protein